MLSGGPGEDRTDLVLTHASWPHSASAGGILWFCKISSSGKKADFGKLGYFKGE